MNICVVVACDVTQTEVINNPERGITLARSAPRPC